MPTKDIYHDVVKRALIKAKWVITHDPLPLKRAGRNLYIDLGAESVLAFEVGQVGEVLLKKGRVQLLIFDLDTEAIVRWIA